MHSGHGKLAVDLVVSLATTTLSVAAVALATPWIIDFYGIDYTKLTELFVLLFATQWLNGAGRPAIRHLAANWNFALVRRILFVSMTVAIAASVVGNPGLRRIRRCHQCVFGRAVAERPGRSGRVRAGCSARA